MIPYSRDHQFSLHNQSVKIIGLGGAGINILHRVTHESLDNAQILAVDSDSRLLHSDLKAETLQLGKNLTKGLGAGGDPELGSQAAQETEAEIRAAIKGHNLIFLCVGLGGGIGSGAAPLITRIAREENAFVVVFATTPFRLEGKRRQAQAQATLNELTVLANALVTFDNNRMGELIVEQKGIHDAFSAADVMISQSIKSVIRLVLCPGLINIGLDDLISALRAKRSRCLFGAGFAEGKDRALRALNSALSSPLLDQGTLLKNADTVIVHISGGQDLTLAEVEVLMKELERHIPETAHVLFGAAVDESAQNSINVTLISALPEDTLDKHQTSGAGFLPAALDTSALEPSSSFAAAPTSAAKPAPEIVVAEKKPAPTPVATKSTPISPEVVEAEKAEKPATITKAEPTKSPEAKAEEKPQAASATNESQAKSPEKNPPAADEKIEPKFEAKTPTDTTAKAEKPTTKTSTERFIDEDEEEIPSWMENPSSWTGKSKDDASSSTGKSDSSDLFGESSTLTSKGRFDGNPTIVDGENLDIPPYLSKLHNK